MSGYWIFCWLLSAQLKFQIHKLCEWSYKPFWVLDFYWFSRPNNTCSCSSNNNVNNNNRRRRRKHFQKKFVKYFERNGDHKGDHRKTACPVTNKFFVPQWLSLFDQNIDKQLTKGEVVFLWTSLAVCDLHLQFVFFKKVHGVCWLIIDTYAVVNVLPCNRRKTV